MGEPIQLLIAGVIAVFAGALGSMVGVGGGLIIVPVLTVLLGVPFKVAAAASLIGVIATSIVAGRRYLLKELVDRRLGLLLLIATASGRLAAGTPPRFSTLGFSPRSSLLSSSSSRRRSRGERGTVAPAASPAATTPAGLYSRFRLGLALAISTVAGALSGLLGIGGGVINVPTISVVLRVPFRVAVATSTYMLGATAAASSSVYYARGQLDPLIAAPVALGIASGAQAGSRLAPRVRVGNLRLVFAALCVILAVQLVLKVV